MRHTLSVCLILMLGISAMAADSPREVRNLEGKWKFRSATGNEWKDVRLPAAWETHEGEKFDGVGEYRRSLTGLTVPKGKRLLLHFDAVATHATVSLNGVELGSHLGGWTPFRFDITEIVSQAKPDATHTLTVRVDERVGHNTQGFLPVFLPHFGGIWRDVRLLTVPEEYIDDLRASAIGNPDTDRIEFRLPVKAETLAGMEVRVGNNVVKHDEPKREGDQWRFSVPVKEAKRWSPASPSQSDITVCLGSGDEWRSLAAFRKIETKGEQLLLNGTPLGVRGVLNWGYHPPLLHPTDDEREIREELQDVKAMGFNLVKCCLWVPPRKYLELADQMGMLVWIEYPTWHPKLDQKHLPDLEREFREFFYHDRDHPCIILRSLTCETGPSADVKVIKRLYDLAKEMVPGAVVEDDSSWIGWNRVHDFWDDHPYGNNHTWVGELTRLKQHVKQNSVKPLLLGEAIAADTWVDRKPLLDDVGKDRPFWLPGFFDANAEWEERLRKHVGPTALDSLRKDSERYAFLMRKYQIETFRREVPSGGYVVSVIRDFPFAGMGLLNFSGERKWPATEWAWHTDSMLLLRTPSDRRSYRDGERFDMKLQLSHSGEPLAAVVPSLDFCDQKLGIQSSALTGPFTVKSAWQLLDSGEIKAKGGETPIRNNVTGALHTDDKPRTSNSWDVWVTPQRRTDRLPALFRHSSLAEPVSILPKTAKPLADAPADDLRKGVVVASRFDAALLDHLEAGGKVLMLPNGQKNSFPLAAHWFLRGGPVVLDHPALKDTPREMLIDTQHFDLAGDVIPNVGTYLEQFDPIFLLWDNHDIKEVRTHGLVFEANVGKGRLLVSALRHHGNTNAIGEWLFDRFVTHLATGPAPKYGFDDATRKRIRLHLSDEPLDLTKSTWKFRPDPKNEGVKDGWHTPEHKLDDWKEIHVGQHWEGAGFPDLDGWAWYRLTVDVPKKWAGLDVYLHTEGVDDAYEIHVNGKKVSSGGDILKKLTAFEERKSHPLGDSIVPGKPATIAIRVFDWYGAGGIHRPVSLGTAPRFDGPDILR